MNPRETNYLVVYSQAWYWRALFSNRWLTSLHSWECGEWDLADSLNALKMSFFLLLYKVLVFILMAIISLAVIFPWYQYYTWVLLDKFWKTFCSPIFSSFHYKSDWKKPIVPMSPTWMMECFVMSFGTSMSPQSLVFVSCKVSAYGPHVHKYYFDGVTHRACHQIVYVIFTPN